MINGTELVKLINQSELAKSYCGIDKSWKNIIKLTYNSVHRLVGFDGDKPLIQANFYGGRKFKDSITTNMLLNMKREGVFEHLERRFGQPVDLSYLNSGIKKVVYSYHKAPQEFIATADFNPDANPESTSVDGYVSRENIDETFVNQRTGGGNQASDSNTYLYQHFRYSGTSGQNYYIRRIICLFDTSSLGSGVTITATDFKLYGIAAVSEGIDAESFDICSSNPANNTGLATGDYDYNDFGTTSFGNKTMATFNASGINTIALNASGIANISKTGISKFGTRDHRDLSNSAGTWGSFDRTHFNISSADNGSNEPTLTVTYSLPTGYANLLLLGVG